MATIGNIIKYDLDNKSIVVQIEGNMCLLAGRFALVHIPHYENLISLAQRCACQTCEFKDTASAFIKPCSTCGKDFINYKPTFKL
jgi:hypothetical protein